MKREGFLFVFLFFLLLALTFQPVLQAQPVEEGAQFSDNFDGDTLDSAKWAVIQDTNASGRPAYGGKIALADSKVTFSSAGSSYPCVTAKTNPFPERNFTLEVNIRYDRITGFGCGLWVSSSPWNITIGGKDADIFQVWADTNVGACTVFLGKMITLSHASSVDFIFRLERSGNMYYLHVNGTLLSSGESQLQPRMLGFGHPFASYVPYEASVDWTQISIDYVKILGTPKIASLSLSTDGALANLGYIVNINGALVDEQAQPLSGKTIVFYYSVPGLSSWNLITSAVTGGNGTFSVSWLPTATGNFIVKAVWTGDDNYSEVSVNKNVSVTMGTGQSLFYAESNSTLSALSFDQNTSKISFSVSGSEGTSGYVRFLISNALITNSSAFSIFVDGQQVEYTMTPLGEMQELYFTYHHSTHNIIMQLPSNPTPQTATASPKAQSNGYSVILGIVIIVLVELIAVFTVLALKKKLKS